MAFGPGELQTVVLRAVQKRGQAATLHIAQDLAVPEKRVSKAASSLIDRRYLRRVRIGIYEITPTGVAALATGQVITSGPIDASANALARPVTNGFRDRLWQSMRMRGSFTIHDLVCDAVDGEADAVTDAGRYIRYLKAAGYIRDLPGRVPGTKPGSNGFKRFRLAKNTGPRAPLHRSKLGVLHDFNTGKDVPCSRS